MIKANKNSGVNLEMQRHRSRIGGGGERGHREKLNVNIYQLKFISLVMFSDTFSASFCLSPQITITYIHICLPRVEERLVCLSTAIHIHASK